MAGPGFLNITRRRRCPGPGGRAHRRGRGGVRRLRGGPQAAGQHRVRLRQPDRPGHAGERALGGGRRHPRAAARGHGSVVAREYYFNDHGAQIDRFSQSLRAAARGEPTPEDGYRAVHHRDRRAGRGRAPRGAGPARRRGARGVPGPRRGHDVRGDQADAARLPGAVRRVVPRERPLRVRRDRPGIGAAARAGTSTSRTAPSGCAPRSSATTRTASSSSPTGTAPTSPATRRTTSTSGSAASTAASSCSGPTTTATSAG